MKKTAPQKVDGDKKPEAKSTSSSSPAPKRNDRAPVPRKNVNDLKKLAMVTASAKGSKQQQDVSAKKNNHKQAGGEASTQNGPGVSGDTGVSELKGEESVMQEESVEIAPIEEEEPRQEGNVVEEEELDGAERSIARGGEEADVKEQGGIGVDNSLKGEEEDHGSLSQEQGGALLSMKEAEDIRSSEEGGTALGAD
eukprot:308859-Hanusia_phi.AAC.8